MPKQILLADDSVTIGKIVQLTFAHEDAVVTAVKSGDEALANARASRPDIVLVDAAMPGKTGYEVCAELRSAGIDVPVLILTGNFSPYDEAKGKGAGADGNVVKPFETQALIDRVNQLISQRSSGKPVAAAPAAVTNKIEPLAPPIAAPPKPAPAPAPVAAPPAPAPKPAEPAPAPKPASPLPPAMGKPGGTKPAVAPRATLMGIPTVSPTGVPTFSAPLPPSVPPTPAAKIEPPKPGQQPFTAREAATVVDMPAPALPPVAPPKPEPKIEVAPPPPKPEPKIEIAPPPPKVELPPPPAPPKPEPRIEVAPPPPKIEVVHAPPKAAEPSLGALKMPRPSLIPHAPTPQPRNDTHNDFSEHVTTRKVDVPGLARGGNLIDAVAREAAPRVAEALGGAAAKGADYEAIAKLSREVIEQIAWEVVPDLAEAIIKAEVERLVKERKIGA
jgi:CheY-like chemotaxis protein